MTKDEALKMAIEVMQAFDSQLPTNSAKQAIQACKEALEQTSVAELNNEYLRDTYVEGLSSAQEPVAFCKHGVPKGVCTLGEKDCNKPGWNSLTKIEIMELFKVYPSDPGFHMLCDQVKLIDDKLKEKNA